MKKIISFLFFILLSISINTVGNSQNCNGPFDVDLSSNGQHSIYDVMQQLGLNSIEEFCTTLPDFNMVLGGTLLIDNSNVEICFHGTEIKMLENARIIVNNETILNMDSVHIYGCDVMWDYILVSYATLNVYHSTIEDAKQAINQENLSDVNLQSCIFKNNIVGLSIGNTNTDDVIISVSDCTFTSDYSFLNSQDNVPIRGISVIANKYLDLSPKVGETNTFERLNFGIHVKKGAVRVNNSIFQYFDDFFTTIEGVETILESIGVYLANPDFNSTSIVNHNTFISLSVAIKAVEARIYAQYNDIDFVSKGIIIDNSDIINVGNNTIDCSKIGISANLCNNLYSYSSLFTIYNNTIELSTSSNMGKAISAELSDEMNIHDNTITMVRGEAGIFVSESDDVVVEDNEIEIFGAVGSEIKAIHIESSEYVDVSGNSLIDTYSPCCVPSNIGIFSDNSFGNFACNTMEYFSKGMHYIANCAYSRLDGNKYHFLGKDLVLGEPGSNPQTATIGKQGDFTNNIGWGNKWYDIGSSSAYNYSPYNYVNWSQFLVNADNQIYKPYNIVAEANNWFWDRTDVTNESSCSNIVVIDPPLGGLDCGDIINKILVIDTSSVFDECNKAIWQYHYFKKLLLLKKLNLLENDCLTFFNNNANNVLVQIAKIDSAITNILLNQSVDSVLYSNILNTQMQLNNLHDQGAMNTQQWEQTMTLYDQLLSVHSTHMEAEKTSDDQKADSIKNVITTITVSDTCLKILLKTFDIELDYIKNDTLTAAQLFYVREVSELCPNEFGDGVYLARSLRSIFEYVRYRSVKDCSSDQVEPRSSAKVIAVDNIDLYPNPAIDELNISVDISQGESGVLNIVDLKGSVIRSLRVNDNKSIFKINTKEFMSGIYLVKYLSNTGAISIEKLVISK